MSSRSRGNSFEYRVKRYLEKQGWFVIRRGRSGFPDLHCYRRTSDGSFEIMEVECKNRKRYPRDKRKLLSGEDMKKVREIVGLGISFVLAVNERNGRKCGKIKMFELR